MKKVFNSISDSLFKELKSSEDVILSFSGENSQFIRFNNGSVRQTGMVDDADIELKFISNNRICGGGFTISGDMEIDLARGKHEIERMRHETNELPEDPFLVLPKNLGSSNVVKEANGLKFEDSIDAILPAMSGTDFVGILANAISRRYFLFS